MAQPVEQPHGGCVMSGIRGWCPGALRPMPSGDGLVLRIRARGSRLTVAQAHAIADLAEGHGSGWIDLGSRAHLQLRGVAADALPRIHTVLADHDLIDPDPAAEARRNILTTPCWDGEETPRLVSALETALGDAPPLPAKFGFAVDTGQEAVLGGASADIRIERAAEGLILRPDGMAVGEPVPPAAAPARAVALARWFAAGRGDARRMADLLARGETPPLTATAAPRAGPALRPGHTPFGLCLALPFGQMRAATLRALAVAPVRLTPWRALVLEGVEELTLPAGVIADPANPLLRVAACTGAPGCASATVETRSLARHLAPMLAPEAGLHVSGCAKGCAHPRTATVTLTGRDGRFDLIPNGRPGDTPLRRALSPDDIPDLLRGRLAP